MNKDKLRYDDDGEHSDEASSLDGNEAEADANLEIEVNDEASGDEDDSGDNDSSDDAMDDEFGVKNTITINKDISEYELKRQKRQKLGKDGGSSNFNQTIRNVLQSDHNKQGGGIVLSKRKTVLMKQLEEANRAKARNKERQARKRAMEQASLVLPEQTSLNKEKRLRKVATRGVVAFFNTLRTTQNQIAKTNALLKKEKRNNKKVKEISKESFMNLLKDSTKWNVLNDKADIEDFKNNDNVEVTNDEAEEE